MIIKDGFQYPTYDHNADFVLGGARSAPLKETNASGDWTAFLPKEERQKTNRGDTNGCTNFGTLSQIQIALKALFEKDTDWSERFQAVVSGQGRYGNNPQNVYNSVRKYGCLPDKRLPLKPSMDFDEYLSPNPMTSDLKSEAREWGYTLKHEYLYPPLANVDRKAYILEALKRSPVGVSTYAWKKQGGVYVKPGGAQDTHWCVCVGGNDKHALIWDSYAPHLKQVSWDNQFDVASGIYIEESASSRGILYDYLKIFRLWQ